MITGFNTDVEFDGVTYHVQTEDKGLETPLILTLVYDRGTILASKRQGYEDLVEEGFDEEVLATRLNRQHSLICAAIRSGKIDKLVAQTRRESKKKAVSKSEAGKRAVPNESDDEVSPIPKPTHTDLPEPEPVVDVVSVVEDEVVVLPNEAVEIVSHMAGRDRPVHNRLCVEFINETPFKGGERKSVTFMVSRGTERKVVGDAQILVKIIGTNFRPKIFHSTTDKNGLAQLDLEMPDFSGGRAAFLVRASNAGEEIELRRVILES